MTLGPEAHLRTGVLENWKSNPDGSLDEAVVEAVEVHEDGLAETVVVVVVVATRWHLGSWTCYSYSPSRGDHAVVACVIVVVVVLGSCNSCPTFVVIVVAVVVVRIAFGGCMEAFL